MQNDFQRFDLNLPSLFQVPQQNVSRVLLGSMENVGFHSFLL